MFLGTLTIAAGQTNSNDLPFHDMEGYTIHAPATLPEVVTVQLRQKTGAVWGSHQSLGVDITLTAGKVTTVVKGQGAQIRVQAGSAVGAARVFEVYGHPERS